MASSDKVFFIEAYFEDLKVKIDRLPGLNKSFRDEALVLCTVYVDWLASCYYFDGSEKNKRKFCRALIELSGNTFMGAIHPKELLESARTRGQTIESLMASIIKTYPGQFLVQDKIAEHIWASSLSDSDKSSLVDNLWRASVAAICYERIRCLVVHGPGRSTTLSFDKTQYQGKVGMKVDFQMLHAALASVFEAVKQASLKSGKWFGNSLYDHPGKSGDG